MSTKNQIVTKMRNLIRILRQHNHLYYVMGESAIQDDEYDQLRLELIALENEHPDLIQIDSPILTVGGKPESTFDTKKHNVPMLSLGNVFNFDELVEFVKRTELDIALLLSSDIFILEHKFDGLALSIIYKSGVLTQALTRGDGKYGEDVTNKVINISNVPSFIQAAASLDTLEVRGEVIMTKSGFSKYNEVAIANGLTPFANARNAAAGSMRQKSNDKPRPLAFYAYSINQGYPPGVTHQVETLNWLAEVGFSIGKYELAGSVENIQQHYNHLIETRDNIPYDIDGMVIKINSLATQLELGNKAREPKWAMAYKFPAKNIVTTLTDVSWQVGRVGQITPVGHVKTVNVGGVNISNVTLHNTAEIERLNLMIGDTVTLERAGDVIPKITKTWVELRPDDAQPITLPKNCPSCNNPITPIEGDTMVFCMAGLECPKQRLGSLEHFVSRECMDIDGLAQGTLQKFLDANLITTISDIYRLKDRKKELTTLEGFGDKSFDKMVESIEKKKHTTLQRFIYALGIRNVGEGTSTRLQKHYGNLDNFLSTTIEELESIVDIGPITAEQIYQFITRESNRKVIQELLDFGVTPITPDRPPVAVTKTWGITGSFDQTRSEIKEELTQSGIILSSSVTKNIDALLVGEKPSGSKVEKAKKLNIPIIYQF